VSGLRPEPRQDNGSRGASDDGGPRLDPDRLFRSAAARGIPLGTIVATVAVVVVAYLAGKVLYRVRDVVLLLLVAGLLALLLNPFVAGLQRWKVRRRSVAVGIVVMGAFIVSVGLAVIFGYYLVNGGIHLARSLPSYVANAEQGKGWIGQLVRRFHLQAWAEQNQGKVSSLASGLGKPAVALGKGAASVIAEVGITLALVVMLLLEGPKMRCGLLSMLSPARAKRYARVGSEISRTVTGYIVGDSVTSIVAGVVVFVTLSALSVPYAALWAGWVAFVDYLPSIGGALAGIPTVLFALGHSLTAGIVTAVVFVVYTQVENHLLNPLVMAKTVKVSPLLVAVAVLVGAVVGNWIGGVFAGFAAILLAVPTAGALQVIAKDLWNPPSSGEAVETRGCVVPAKQARPHDGSTHSQDQED
jgi:predicted PurR-regulated permease PerM